MKKLLLIGELNQTVSSVNKHLATCFQTQVCVNSLDLVKGMVKMLEPDLVVACLVGMDRMDEEILAYLKAACKNIPVLIMGTVDECNSYKKYYEEGQFDYITRPTTLSNIMHKCMEVLRLEKPKAVAEPEVSQKKRVLVVDDSGILLRSIKTMLEKQYTVVVATDGMMAIEKAKKRKPDLILLDYEMPRMDGRETLARLREDEELADIPVVFLTGVADEANVAAVLKLKPDGYLLKPVEQQRLYDTIEGVLAGEI